MEIDADGNRLRQQMPRDTAPRPLGLFGGGLGDPALAGESPDWLDQAMALHRRRLQQMGEAVSAVQAVGAKSGNGVPVTALGLPIPMPSPRDNPFGAARDFRRNFMDMRTANMLGGDKYFHCKANCEAAKRGPFSRWSAEGMSDLREIYGQMKGDPRKDMIEDQAANRMGRSGAEQFPQRSCRQICQPVRPNGLPRGY